jgi:Ni,Fe-hydrogenase III small subunit/Fe-S-cluster-containing hydrogenase component 2
VLNLLKEKIIQGSQYIKNIKKAEINKMFKGFPVINCTEWEKCGNCGKVCLNGAINETGFDLGKCTFCGDCVRECKNGYINFSNFHKMATDARKNLIIKTNTDFKEFEKYAFRKRKEIKRIFGRSLKLRSVSAGGCNACEMELGACSNVNFDMGRFGIEMVASPRHSDGIVITGPITGNMSYALLDTYKAVPKPKIVILMGTCAISGGLFASSNAINREFLENIKPDIYIPGCPVHPLTFINGILSFLGK